MLHFTLTCEQDLEVLHFRQQLILNPKRAVHHSPAENQGLRLGGDDPHPSHFTLSCKLSQVHARGYGLIKLKEPHYLQKGERQF